MSNEFCGFRKRAERSLTKMSKVFLLFSIKYEIFAIFMENKKTGTFIVPALRFK